MLLPVSIILLLDFMLLLLAWWMLALPNTSLKYFFSIKRLRKLIRWLPLSSIIMIIVILNLFDRTESLSKTVIRLFVILVGPYIIRALAVDDVITNNFAETIDPKRLLMLSLLIYCCYRMPFFRGIGFSSLILNSFHKN